jgi:hypothetical protein
MFNNALLMGAASAAASGGGGYTVDYSCRFDGANKAYLQFTPTTSSAAQKTYNLSAWVKKGNLNIRQVIIGVANSGASAFSYALMSSNDTYNQFGSSASSAYHMYDDNLKMRDPTAWMHIMVAIDTTQSVAADRAKIYYNGVEITTFTAVSYPSLNLELIVNNASYDIAVGTLGAWGPETAFDGYIAQPAMVTELALTATDFGEFDSNGVWRPIDITGLDYSGENSFLLDFADSSDLGNDVSGNDNDFTNSGLVASDQMTDTPTNNFCVMSPIDKSSNITLSNGNLITTGSGSSWYHGRGTLFATSGKWYYEWTPDSGSYALAGWMTNIDSNHYEHEGSTETAQYRGIGAGSGLKLGDQTNITSVANFAVADVVMMAIDIDTGEVWVGVDGTWEDDEDPGAGGTATGTWTTFTGTAFTPWTGQFSNANSFNFGQTAFAHTIPTGFSAWSTASLPTPTILDGTANFQTTLYTGDGSVRNIDQTENSTFQPDLVWIKNRSAADNHFMFDAPRGVTKYWAPDTHGIEVTNANSLTSFDSDGFGLGTGAGGFNDSTENFVAWQWLAGGGAGSSNEEGSINTTTTTVNTAAGISLSTFVGDNVAGATIGHGLGAVPEFIIGKPLTGGHNGTTYVVNLGEDYGVYLDLPNAPYNGLTYWNDTAPTSSLITFGTSAMNLVGVTTIVYAFAPIEGFSKFGGYTGNGNADGTYTYTGFKPAFVMIKKTSGIGSWVMYDSQRSPYNEIDDQLVADAATAETTGSEELDFLSNGFKIRTTDSDVNTSAGTYFFAAFAEYPFGGDGVTPSTAF